MVAYYDLLANNAIFPVSDVLSDDYYNALPESERYLAQALDFKGKTFTFGHGLDIPYPYHMWVVVYNKSLLERENQPDIYDLYLAGDWTWDKATEILRGVTRDTDGDGVTDQFGMRYVDALTPTIFAATNEGAVTDEDENGKVVFTFDEEPAIEALELIYQWKTVDKVVGGDNAAFYAGKVAMDILPVWGIGQNMSGLTGSGDEFAIVPLPRGPRANDHVYPLQAVQGRVMSADAENPEALIALDEFLFQGANDDTLNEYLAAYSFSRQSAEVLVEVLANFRGESNFMMEGVLGGHGFFDASTAVIEGTKGAKVAMSEIKPVMQSRLDTLFGQ